MIFPWARASHTLSAVLINAHDEFHTEMMELELSYN
jgi:hypothetical protein